MVDPTTTVIVGDDQDQGPTPSPRMSAGMGKAEGGPGERGGGRRRDARAARRKDCRMLIGEDSRSNRRVVEPTRFHQKLPAFEL